MNTARMLTCRELIEFLWKYVSFELTPAERAEFDRHLAACASCVAYLESYRATTLLAVEACQPGAPVPGDVPEELVAAVLSATGGGS